MKKGIYHIDLINTATQEAKELRVAADDFEAAYQAAKAALAETCTTAIVKIEQTEMVRVV